MVKLIQAGSQRGDPTWVLQPTRSMSWAQASALVAAIAVVSGLIGGIFWILGFPLVLPFSGLEAIAVAVAFYLVLRSGEKREVVRLEADKLVIERGRREPEDQLVFNRFWVSVRLAQPARSWHPARLLIAGEGQLIELGQFLTEGERESFAQTLINALKKKR